MKQSDESVTVRATVLIPTHDHGPTLIFSVKSVLAQTVRDLEVFIVGDGVPSVTREIVAQLQRDDDRVRFFDHPKGPRHGEIYRHAALAHARGRIICYQGDDDLWLPYHLETMERLLNGANFAHTLSVAVTPEANLQVWPHVDLTLPGTRDALSSGTLRFNPSLSSFGHTLELYRQLPFGWRTTPEGTATDRYMLRQFLEHPDCRPASSPRPTLLKFPSPPRATWSLDQRVAELEDWSGRIADTAWLAEFPSAALDALVRARRGRPRRQTSNGDKAHAELEELRARYDRMIRRQVKWARLRAKLNADRHQLRSKLARMRIELEHSRGTEHRLRADLARVRSSPAIRFRSWAGRVTALKELLTLAARWVSGRPAR